MYIILGFILNATSFYGVKQYGWASLGSFFLTKTTEIPPKFCRTQTSLVTKALASRNTRRTTYLRTEIPLKSPMVLESAAPDEVSYSTQVCFGRFSTLLSILALFSHIGLGTIPFIKPT